VWVGVGIAVAVAVGSGVDVGISVGRAVAGVQAASKTVMMRVRVSERIIWLFPGYKVSKIIAESVNSICAKRSLKVSSLRVSFWLRDLAWEKIGTAVLKHQIKKLVGEDALGAIGEELADISGEKFDE